MPGTKRYVFTEDDRLKRVAPLLCVNCGKGYAGYKDKRACSTRCLNTIKYRDPFENKIRAISANLLMGKGKKEKVTALLKNNIGTPCIYCQTTLTLENVSLDHKVPIGSNKVRRQKKDFVEERRVLDEINNLQIICRSCNSIKGKIPHTKFVTLLLFLEQDLELKDLVLQRMKQSIAFWRKY